MIPFSTRVTVPATVMFRDLDGEAVILETGSGRYFGLNEVGTRMWLLLQSHGEVGAAYRQLSAEYQVAPQELLQDLEDFVATLASRQLIEIGLP